MVQVKNIGTGTHVFSEPYNVKLKPGEVWDNAPAEFASRLMTTRGIEVNWGENEIKWKTNGKVSHINYLSPFDPYDGYGIVGCTTLMNFERYGIHASVPNPVFTSVRAQLTNTYPKVLEIIDRPDRMPTKWGLSHTIPPDIDLLPCEKKALHTMWEARLIPDLWQPYVMKADAIIVPSRGQIGIFRDSGYDGPMYVVPDPIDMDAFTYYNRPERETFTFFVWGKMTSRKDPWANLTAFANAFPKEKDVRLIIKTRGSHFGMGRTAQIPEIRDPRIKVIDTDWSLSRLVRQCHESDCGIFFSHGEGSMNPPVQMMATGAPVIGPNHSGCTEWSNPKYCYPVGLDKRQPFVESTLGTRNGKPLEWWNMDMDEAIEQMRYVYNHRAAAKEKGRKASEWVRKNFTVDHSMTSLVSVLNQLD